MDCSFAMLCQRFCFGRAYTNNGNTHQATNHLEMQLLANATRDTSSKSIGVDKPSRFSVVLKDSCHSKSCYLLETDCGCFILEPFQETPRLYWFAWSRLFLRNQMVQNNQKFQNWMPSVDTYILPYIYIYEPGFTGPPLPPLQGILPPCGLWWGHTCVHTWLGLKVEVEVEVKIDIPEPPKV